MICFIRATFVCVRVREVRVTCMRGVMCVMRVHAMRVTYSVTYSRGVMCLMHVRI